MQKMDAMMDALDPDNVPTPEEDEEYVTVGRDGTVYSIPQRKYVPTPEDGTEQWLEYYKKMEPIQEARDKAREERKARFKREREEADERMRQRRAEAEAKAKEEPELEDTPGTMAWFTKRMQGQVVNTFDYMRLNATEEQAPQFLKIAIKKIVENNGDTFKDDDYVNAYIPIIAKWMRTHEKMGLLLRGNVGVGKTTIAKAIASVYTICNGRGFRIFNALELSRIAREDEQTFRDICNYPMLGIDDLGIEATSVKNFGNEITPMVELIMHRQARRMFTVITTNLAVDAQGEDEINQRYGKRVGDRVHHLCSTLKFDGSQKSYRQ